METQTLGDARPPSTVLVSQPYPGRDVFHDRVILRVVEEASAVALGIDRGKIDVRVSTAERGMAVTIRSPLPVPPLDDDNSIAAAGSILDRISAMQARLREQIGRITGRDVARVNITITGALVQVARRVK